MSEKVRLAAIVLFFVGAGASVLWWQALPSDVAEPVAASAPPSISTFEPETESDLEPLVEEPSKPAVLSAPPEIEAANPAATQTATISGRVYDREHNTGIPGVVMELRPMAAGLGEVVAKATSDADGYYRMEGVTADVYRVSCYEIAGYAQGGLYNDFERIAVAPGIDFPAVNFAFSKGLSISGVVTDDEGNLLEGVWLSAVTTQPANSNNVLPNQRISDRRRSSVSGKFTLYGFPSGANIEIHTTHPKYTTDRTSVKMARRNIGDLRFVMTKGAAVSAVVVDEDDNPIPNLKMFAVTTTGRRYTKHQTSNERGEIQFDGLRAGNHKVFTLKKNQNDFFEDSKAIAEITVRNDDALEGIRWVVQSPKETGLQISANILDDLGAPIPNVRLMVFRWVQNFDSRGKLVGFIRSRSASPFSDENGKLQFLTQKDHQYTIEGKSPNHGRGKATKIKAGESNVKIVLPRHGSVSGRVVYKDSQLPVTDFKMNVVTETNGRSVFTISVGDGTNETIGFSLANSWTRYHHPDGKFLIGGVETGKDTRLATYVDGYQTATNAVSVTKNGQTLKNVLIEVDTGVILHGLVTNEVGTPIPGATIMKLVVSPSHGGIVASPGVTTDTHGRFEMTNLPLGPQSLQVYTQGVLRVRTSVRLTGPVNEETIVLNEGGKISGYVTMDGEPMPDVAIGFDGNARVRTDENGFYEIKAAEAGTNTLVAKFFLEGIELNLKKTVHVDVGATAILNFEFDAAVSSIEGRILLSEDDPTSGQITLNVDSGRDVESRFASVGKDGKYHFKNLRGGNVLMRIYGKHIQNQKIIRTVLGEGEELKMDTLLYGGATIVCRVENSPPDTMAIGFLLPADMQIPLTVNRDSLTEFNETCYAVTDANEGLITMVGIQPGEYTLAVVALDDTSGEPGDGAPVVTRSLVIDDERDNPLAIAF
jgi:hypothetical protein